MTEEQREGKAHTVKQDSCSPLVAVLHEMPSHGTSSSQDERGKGRRREGEEMRRSGGEGGVTVEENLVTEEQHIKANRL